MEEKVKKWRDNNKLFHLHKKRRARNPPELPRGKGE
jgi:hypothetical protein